MFIPKELSLGSVGPEVKYIQDELNLLPSMWPRLTSSGIFDLPTRNRVIEFQRQAYLFPDGMVGGITRARLINMVSKQSEMNSKRSEATPTFWHRVDDARVAPTIVVPTTPADPNEAMRAKIVEIAEKEAKTYAWKANGAPGSVVAAKLSQGNDGKLSLRMGWQRLLEYFHVAAPGVFSDQSVKYLTTVGELAPMPHWCGIFALWAYKTAGVNVGTWQIGSGISSVKGFKQVPKHDARKGDVGYFNQIVPPATQAFQHHFILKEVHPDGSLVTIEGNSEEHSNFNIKPMTRGPARTLDTINGVFSAF